MGSWAHAGVDERVPANLPGERGATLLLQQYSAQVTCQNLVNPNSPDRRRGSKEPVSTPRQVAGILVLLSHEKMGYLTSVHSLGLFLRNKMLRSSHVGIFYLSPVALMTKMLHWACRTVHRGSRYLLLLASLLPIRYPSAPNLWCLGIRSLGIKGEYQAFPSPLPTDRHSLHTSQFHPGNHLSRRNPPPCANAAHSAHGLSQWYHLAALVLPRQRLQETMLAWQL